jgi:hypothetical protein
MVMAKGDDKDEKKSEPTEEKKEMDSGGKKEETKAATDTIPSPADKEPAYTGKNSVLKWILIYVVIGAIIYGVWYYFSQSRSTSATDAQTNSLY